MSSFTDYPSTTSHLISAWNGSFLADNGSRLDWSGSNITSDEFGMESEVIANTKLSPEGPKTDKNGQILGVISFVVAAIALLLNLCLLWSISRVSLSKLRAKRLIQSSSIANLVLPLVTTLDLTFLEALFRVKLRFTLNGMCFNGVYFLILMIASILHTMSVFGLTLDRVYAVVKPLDYRTVGYNKMMKVAMSAIPITFAVGIWLGFALSAIDTFPRPKDERYTFCSLLYHTFFLMRAAKFAHIFHITVHVVAFLMYIGIFIVIKYQYMKMQYVSDSATRKTNLSLSITYFLISISAICLYLPWPLYPIFNPSTLGSYVIYTTKALRTVYFLNSILDPIVFMIRIRSIRENLPFGKRREKTKPVSRITKSTEISHQGHPGSTSIPLGKQTTDPAIPARKEKANQI